MRECLFLGGPRDGQRRRLRPGPVPVGEVCHEVIDMAGYRPVARLDRGGVLQEVSGPAHIKHLAASRLR